MERKLKVAKFAGLAFLLILATPSVFFGAQQTPAGNEVILVLAAYVLGINVSLGLSGDKSGWFMAAVWAALISLRILFLT